MSGTLIKSDWQGMKWQYPKTEARKSLAPLPPSSQKSATRGCSEVGSHGMESAKQWNRDAVPIAGTADSKEPNPHPLEALGCKGFASIPKAAVPPEILLGWSTGVMSQVGSGTSP